MDGGLDLPRVGREHGAVAWETSLDPRDANGLLRFRDRDEAISIGDVTFDPFYIWLI